MAYVIYNEKTCKRYETAMRTASWAQKGSAKSVLTKAIKSGDIKNGDDWKVGTYEEWQANDRDIEVISAMDGKTVCKIKASEKGNRVSDPSMEGYWTM